MSSENSSQPETSGRAKCPRRYELVRVVMGEASEKEGDSIRHHTACCGKCRSDLETLSRQREEFVKWHPFNERFTDMFQTASSRHHRRQFIFRLAPIASVVCLAVIGLFIWNTESPRPVVRTKGGELGGVSLNYYVKEDQGYRLAERNEILGENDRIQFSYHAGPHRHLFLVSIDGNGQVSNFNYQSSEISLPVKPGGSHFLDGSIILDDAEGLEQIFGVFSDRSLEWQEVKNASHHAYQEAKQSGQTVRKIQKLPLPYPQASILLIKR